MSWECPKCTFINPPSQISTCQICLSPSLSSSSPSSSSTPKWACKICTFLNSYARSNCEVCDSRASFGRDCSDLDGDFGASVGSVFFPLRRCKLGVKDDEIVAKNDESNGGSGVNANGFRDLSCKRKIQELDDDGVGERGVESCWFRGVESSKSGISVSGDNEAPNSVSEMKVAEKPGAEKDSYTIKILTYNVWFREELEMNKRMKAIGDLIELHSPDVLCFQEVTPNIYATFQKSEWWKKYHCSLSYERAYLEPYFCMQLSRRPVKSFTTESFSYTAMGRKLCIAELLLDQEKSLLVATSHLESPCPGPPKWDQMYSKERVKQANEAVQFLDRQQNVVFCGDMNWDDKLDGQFPLLNGWVDAWEKLRPGETGWTYDTKSNKMLTGNRTLQKRLDRFIYKLKDFEINGIDMVGTEAIPGVMYCKEKKMKNKVQELTLPVLPSDHYGLLLTISSRSQ